MSGFRPSVRHWGNRLGDRDEGGHRLALIIQALVDAVEPHVDCRAVEPRGGLAQATLASGDGVSYPRWTKGASAITFDTHAFGKRLTAAGAMATKGDVSALRTGLPLLERRMTIKLGGLIVVATGLILGAIKFSR